MSKTINSVSKRGAPSLAQEGSSPNRLWLFGFYHLACFHCLRFLSSCLELPLKLALPSSCEQNSSDVQTTCCRRRGPPHTAPAPRCLGYWPLEWLTPPALDILLIVETAFWFLNSTFWTFTCTHLLLPFLLLHTKKRDWHCPLVTFNVQTTFRALILF